jgi:Ca-activated chloride channel family protein
MFSFGAWYWLLLLPLPFLAHWLAPRLTPLKQQPAHAAIMHSQARLLHQLSARRRPGSAPAWYWIAGCCTLVLALARPQWFDENDVARHNGRDIVLALDVSGSMRAMDFVINDTRVNRLDMIKHIAEQFINKRFGDRIGVIVFADDAYTLAPLTRDHNVIHALLQDVDNGMIGEKTALGSAIALGVKRLAATGDRPHAMILFTDGAHTSGDMHPMNAIQLANEFNVRIHTIGIGSSARVPFPKAALETPEIVTVPLDEALLIRIAEETGGRYFFGNDIDTLRAVSDEIDQLERYEALDLTHVPRIELFWLPLSAGLLLLMLGQMSHQRVAPAS